MRISILFKGKQKQNNKQKIKVKISVAYLKEQYGCYNALTKTYFKKTCFMQRTKEKV